MLEIHRGGCENKNYIFIQKNLGHNLSDLYIESRMLEIINGSMK